MIQVFLWLVSRNGLSRFVGWAAAARAPKWLLRWAINRYVRFYNVDLTEVRDSLESYETFNAFFTRALKAGARPITDSTVVSPVDGLLSQRGALESGQLQQVKGKSYSLEGLLGSVERAEEFKGGSYATIYLSPRDYHRIHSPVEGEITGFSVIPGKLYPVNNLALPRVDQLFNVNERWTTYFRTEKGRFALVKVGATSVGSVSVAYDTRRTNDEIDHPIHESAKQSFPVKKGAEIARFNLGSTVVLLSENRLPELESIPPGTFVKLGESLSP